MNLVSRETITRAAHLPSARSESPPDEIKRRVEQLIAELDRGSHNSLRGTTTPYALPTRYRREIALANRFVETVRAVIAAAAARSTALGPVCRCRAISRATAIPRPQQTASTRHERESRAARAAAHTPCRGAPTRRDADLVDPRIACCWSTSPAVACHHHDESAAQRCDRRDGVRRDQAEGAGVAALLSL
jgi:hypothetical protein